MEAEEIQKERHNIAKGEKMRPIAFDYSYHGHLLHHICNIAGFAETKLRVEFGDFSQGGGGGGTHSLQWYCSKLKIPYLIQSCDIDKIFSGFNSPWCALSNTL